MEGLNVEGLNVEGKELGVGRLNVRGLGVEGLCVGGLVGWLGVREACTACWKLAPRLEIRGWGMHPPSQGFVKKERKEKIGKGPAEGCLTVAPHDSKML